MRLALLAIILTSAAAATTAITDENIHAAVNLWISNEGECISTYGHISDWDVSKVTDMKNLFLSKETFNEDISKWDTSSVTTMHGMFMGAYAFNQPIGDWDVSKVTDMALLFYYSQGWTGNTKLLFNQDIGKWDVSAVTNIMYMFYGANSFEQDLTSWAFGDSVSMYYLADSVKLMPSTSKNWPCRYQIQNGGTGACECPASKQFNVASKICLDAIPSSTPTPSPTSFPTPHPCDDGSHGCDKSANGICYKASGNTWTCGCKSGFYCTSGCSAPHTNHVCTVITPAPTSYPTLAPTPSPTISLDEVEGIKQCCAKNVPINVLLPSLTCNDVRGKTDEELKSYFNEASMTISQIVEWLKVHKCLHTSSPTHVCKRTTCSYKEIKHNGVSYWHTLVAGDKNHMEHYHCEKHVHDGNKCECLCNEEFTCTIVHHFKNGRTDGRTPTVAITQKNCAPLPTWPTNAPTTAPTSIPTSTPTNYPTMYPTPFPTPPTAYPTPSPTPHPCDDGSHGCDKSANGICYKAGGNGYTCGCRGGYLCTRGCSAPHHYHTCARITPAPTNYPTPHPTPHPTFRADWWSGRCTACPARWYDHGWSCHGGYTVAERGCGFLGCESRCRAHGH